MLVVYILYVATMIFSLFRKKYKLIFVLGLIFQPYFALLALIAGNWIIIFANTVSTVIWALSGYEWTFKSSNRIKIILGLFPLSSLILFLIVLVGYLMPSFSSTRGRIIYSNPPRIIVSTQNNTLSECLIEATYTDLTSSQDNYGRAFTGLFIKKLEILDTWSLLPTYWFNITGRRKISSHMGGESDVSRCKDDPNYRPFKQWWGPFRN